MVKLAFVIATVPRVKASALMIMTSLAVSVNSQKKYDWGNLS